MCVLLNEKRSRQRAVGITTSRKGLHLQMYMDGILKVAALRLLLVGVAVRLDATGTATCTDMEIEAHGNVCLLHETSALVEKPDTVKGAH